MKDECQRCGSTTDTERFWLLGPLPMEDLGLPIERIAHVYAFRRICASCRVDFAHAVRQWFGGMPVRPRREVREAPGEDDFAQRIHDMPTVGCDFEGCDKCEPEGVR